MISEPLHDFPAMRGQSLLVLAVMSTKPWRIT
jgi:hypothetical protein